jgi:hypothetical protein
MLDPRYLDLVFSQAQCNMNPANMLDLRHLDIIVWHAQGNDHPSLDMSKRMTILLGARPRG